AAMSNVMVIVNPSLPAFLAPLFMLSVAATQRICGAYSRRPRSRRSAAAHSGIILPEALQPFDVPGASCIMMEPEREEYELALRARDGDRDALAELVERTRVRLFALAYAELRHYDDAHDAVASALLRICRHVGELRKPER